MAKNRAELADEQEELAAEAIRMAKNRAELADEQEELAAEAIRLSTQSTSSDERASDAFVSDLTQQAINHAAAARSLRKTNG